MHSYEYITIGKDYDRNTLGLIFPDQSQRLKMLVPIRLSGSYLVAECQIHQKPANSPRLRLTAEVEDSFSMCL